MEKVIFEINRILDSIYSSKFERNDTAMLFVYLRDVYKEDTIIRDLGDFIVHPVGRNRGDSHGRVERYIHKLIQVSEKGGTLTPKPFKKDEIIIKLIYAVEQLGIKVDKKKILLNSDKIITHLFEKLDGVELYFPDIGFLKQCLLKNNPNKLSFCFRSEINEGLIQTSPSALWCVDLFN